MKLNKFYFSITNVVIM